MNNMFTDKFYSLAYFMLFIPFVVLSQQKECGYNFLINRYTNNNIDVKKIIFEADRKTNEYVLNNPITLRSDIVIPVVFHVVWKSKEEFVTEQEMRLFVGCCGNAVATFPTANHT